ncbi:hypothetical protein BDW72DRAFT_209663 [Aspergillus terricola var. indicus]
MEPLAAEDREEHQVTVQQLMSLLTQSGEDDQDQILLQLAEMINAEGNASDALATRLPRSYMPDIDTGHILRIGFGSEAFPSLVYSVPIEDAVMEQICYSFDGQRTARRSLFPQDLNNWDEVDSEMTNDIEIYSVNMFIEVLALFAEFKKIISFLGLAPCLYWQIMEKGHFSLGRRFLSLNGDVKGKKRHESDIWFILPASKLETSEDDNRDPEIQKNVFDNLHMHSTHFPFIQLSFSERMRCFYMKVGLQSRSTRVVINFDGATIEKLCEVCEKGVQQENYDPFIFLCSSISEILHGWVVQGYIYFGKIREIEAKVLALGKSFDQTEKPGSREAREIERKNLQDARKLMLQLHELCSYQLRQNRNLGYLSNIINETVKEHHDIRETLGINLTTFLEAHKNLCTLASWVQGMRQNLESAQKVTDSCLSTLSMLLNMRNNQSVEENTKFLAAMAEYSSKENHQVKDIAEATQRDSEAMKAIAMMTMFYLPASFVATLFSMGIFNFDFESGRKGTISLSSYWWIYAVVAIPLTISTFLFFWFTQKKQQNQGKAIKAKDIE